MATSDAETTDRLLVRDPPSDAAEAAGSYNLRATAAWNRLQVALLGTVPRDIRKARASLRRARRVR